MVQAVMAQARRTRRDAGAASWPGAGGPAAVPPEAPQGAIPELIDADLAEATGVQRRCLVTGEVRPKAMLIRFVVAPDDTVVPDVTERLPGRGMWVSASREAVTAAARKNLFARAARQQVRPLDALADVVEARITRQCVDLLGLSRRTGAAVIGFEEVRAWLRAHAGRSSRGLLVTAVDGAADGRAKVSALAAKAAPEIGRIEVLTGAELGRAWGREWVVHGAVKPSRLATRIAGTAQRLAGFRAPETGAE